MSRVAVLGCGWAGVLASLRVKTLHPSTDVVCIGEDLGGLLRSASVGGYLFDIGGTHVVFSKDPAVLNGILSLGGEWTRKARRAYISLNGYLLPYPFENGIYVLPPEQRARYGHSIISALLENARHGERKPANLRDWIVNTFGREVAEDYLIPYNEKIWKRPVDQISADWVYTPGRLPLPALEDLVKAVAGMETTGYKEQAYFYYPARGGIQSQFEAAYTKAAEAGVRFLTGVRIKEIKKTGERYLVNGEIEADRLVSTLPLREIPHMLNPAPPEEVFKAADRLDYNSVAVVGVGVRRRAPNQHWIYVPDRRYVFHRYAWISNYLQDPPRDRAAVIAEIPIPPGAEIDRGYLIQKTLEGFAELGVAREGDVEVVDVWIHKYGYPVYNLTHRESRETVEKYLTQLGIVTVGRWGNWHYWNTDMIYKKISELI